MTKCLDPNSTLVAILKELIDSEGNNLYGLSKNLKMPAQKISYHMPSLVDAGLVIHDPETGVYIPQLLLMDDDFISVVDKSVDEIFVSASEKVDKVYVESKDIEVAEAVFGNCIRAMILLKIIE